MAYHIRAPINDQSTFIEFCNDRIAKGDAYMRYEGRDIRFGYSYDYRCGEEVESLSVHDVSNAFKSGKMCESFFLEATGDNAIGALCAYLAAVNYNLPAFFDWCASLDVDYEAYGTKYVDSERQITIYKRDNKGVETFSPLALSHLKPLKEIPKKWTISHVRRLLAAGQYSYCGTEMRLTSDYAYDAANEFGKGECSGEDFLRMLTESPSGWHVSQSNGRAVDGDKLAVWCHTFEKRVIQIDMKAPARKAEQNSAVKIPADPPGADNKVLSPKPAGILMS